MADLVTHLLVNQIVGQRRLRGGTLRWFLTGALVPDLASRVPRMAVQGCMDSGWIRPGPLPQALLAGLNVSHIPFGFALVCVAVAAVAPAGWLPVGGRRAAGGWLLAGGLLHLAVDLLQRHITPAYAYLWPLSDLRWELGCTSTEASLVAIPFLAVIAWWSRVRG